MKKQDLILLIAILVLSALLALGFFLSRDGGNTVIVEVDGVITARLPLEVNTEYLIQTPHGENLLVIKDGIARITEADCPDLICVHMGALSPTNVLTCLPHGVIVYLEDIS